MKKMNYKAESIELLDHLRESAAEIIKSGQHHVPMLFLLADAGPKAKPRVFVKTVIGYETPDPQSDKEGYYERFARTFLASTDVIGYVMLVEAWSMKFKKGQKGQTITGPIAEHPDRQEMLFMTVQFRDGYWYCRGYQINRKKKKLDEPAKGDTIRLAEHFDSKTHGHSTRGVVVDLFKYLKPPEERPEAPTYDQIAKDFMTEKS